MLRFANNVYFFLYIAVRAQILIKVSKYVIPEKSVELLFATVASPAKSGPASLVPLERPQILTTC
jgi:hypothetical protein